MQIGHFSGHFLLRIRNSSMILAPLYLQRPECNIDLMNAHAIVEIKYYVGGYAVKSYATVNV